MRIKAIWGLFLFFLFLLLFSFLFLAGCRGGGSWEGGMVSSLIRDSGNISVYFCPGEDCEGKLVGFLEGAEESIDCAFYDLNLERVKKELLEKREEGVGVRVVMDNENLKKFNYSFVRKDKWGLMHNKFCVVDGKGVFMGSMNPTENDVFKNNNNLLLIESKVLAGNYLEEFEEMWGGKFKGGAKVRSPAILLGNITLENYFCPEDDCGERVKEELREAKESIYFMTFSFTHEGIGNVLLLKNLEGVRVEGVMEARQVTKDSKFKVLEYQGIRVVKDGNKGNMHHKVFIIDNRTVITGSFNPTEGGDKRNDENLVIIHDEGLAGRFLEEWGRVRKEAESSP